MSYTLLNNIVWEGTGTHPTYEEGARDGHFLKEIDTGESYFRKGDLWAYINLGLSFIKATKSGNIDTDGAGYIHVSFTTPFINNEYSVALSCQDTGETKATNAYWGNLATTGFDIYTRNKSGTLEPNSLVSWVATRNYNP